MCVDFKTATVDIFGNYICAEQTIRNKNAQPIEHCRQHCWGVGKVHIEIISPELKQLFNIYVTIFHIQSVDEENWCNDTSAVMPQDSLDTIWKSLSSADVYAVKKGHHNVEEECFVSSNVRNTDLRLRQRTNIAKKSKGESTKQQSQPICDMYYILLYFCIVSLCYCLYLQSWINCQLDMNMY